MALKYKVIRCVAYTIEIILLFILQELPYLMPSLLGVRPLLLIAAPMTIAILENEKIGLGFGVFAGLLMDMAMDRSSAFTRLFWACWAFSSACWR